MLRAVIYARISNDRVGAGLGVKRQETDCRALAERLAAQWGATIVIVAVLCDNDVSAYSGRKRKDYQRLCQMIANGEADLVLTWHGDRLHRSTRELEDFIDISNASDVATHTVTAGDYDLTTSNGRFQARIAGAIARRESEHRSERVRAAAAQRALLGRYKGGIRPFGFEQDGMTLRGLQCPACAGLDGFTAEGDCAACGTRSALIPGSEAWWLAEATDGVLASSSLRAQVRRFKAAGVMTSKGNEFEPETLKEVLLRPRNAGINVYRGEEIGPAPWPAIVSEAKFRAVVSILTNPARRTTPGNQPKWLGTSIFRCGVEGCDRTVISTRTGGSKLPSYRCNCRKGHVVRNIKHVDKLVVAKVLDRLSRPDAMDLLMVTEEIDTAALHAEAMALRQRSDELAVEAARGKISVRALTVASKEIETQLAAVEAKIAASAVVDPLASIVGAEDVEARWESLDLDVQQAILRVLVDVIILPAPGGRGPDGSYFDPSKVTVSWKRGASALDGLALAA